MSQLSLDVAPSGETQGKHRSRKQEASVRMVKRLLGFDPECGSFAFVVYLPRI